MDGLTEPAITAAFVVEVGGQEVQRVSVEKAVNVIAQALADNGGNADQAKAAFLVALNRLRRLI